jgi:NAD(P)-dependent dehydrogenase (short-subunit alcohol dehydrogenase family)
VSGRLKSRIALVAGASRGIGAAVAKRFAAEGAHVILTGRTVGGLEETDDAIRAAGGSATLSPFDLKEYDAIDRLGGALAERYGRLDVLVGNAAMLGQLAPMGHVPPGVWEEAVSVNLTAQWRLIRAFDPLLRASCAGRAIFVTSSVAAHPHAYWGVYAVTKAGLETMVRIWAAELEKTNVRVNLLDPGAVRTQMRAAAFPGEDPKTLPPPESVTGAFVELADATCTRHGEVVRAAN